MSDDLELNDDGSPKYAMGLLPSPADYGGLPKFAANNPTIARSAWKAISFASIIFKILNQGRHGSCVGHGTGTAVNKIWRIAGGAPHDFSSCYIYGLINGGRDAGASITQAFQAIQAGVCFEDQVPEGMIYKSQFPQDAFTIAKRFVGWMGYVCHTIDELCSGLQLGGMPVYGVCVGGAFQNYSGDGPIQVGWGAANHCVTADGMHEENGKWYLDGINSWGESWGNKGRFKISIDSVAKDEMFVLMAPPDDPQETNLPPVLV